MPRAHLREFRSAALVLGLSLGFVLVSTVRPALPAGQAASPPPSRDLQAEINALSAAVLDRFEAGRQGEPTLAERLSAVDNLLRRVKTAENRVKAAECQREAFQNTVYRTLVAEARTALIQAQDQARAEAARYAVEPTVANRLALETAQLRVEQTGDHLKTQERFTREQELDRRRKDVQLEKDRLEDLKDRLAGARAIAPSPGELRAIRLLAQAIHLHERNQTDRARDALDQATELWRTEEARRSEIRSREDRRQILKAAPENGKLSAP
jgi:hypothetical protein